VSTKNYTIKYGGNTGTIRIDGYADADWGSDLIQRKSTTGYVFMMNGGPVSWTSKKQTTVALSTMEAEYMAPSDAARELRAHLTFFMCIGINIAPPVLFTDNKAAESIVKHEPDYRRSKHIDIWYHYVRDHYERGTFNVEHIRFTSTTRTSSFSKGGMLGSADHRSHLCSHLIIGAAQPLRAPHAAMGFTRIYGMQ
jgi:hypothetical protein